MPNDRTVICLSLMTACLVGVAALLYVLGIVATPSPSLATPAVSTAAPSRPSGQAIARTCAHKTGVDLSPGALITRAQAQAMEVCAEQLIAIITTP